jgi:hypothetical protein
MPDIAMCNGDECPARAKCYRHKASGTKPSEYRQAYADFQRPHEYERCHEFWPRLQTYREASQFAPAPSE